MRLYPGNGKQRLIEGFPHVIQAVQHGDRDQVNLSVNDISMTMSFVSPHKYYAQMESRQYWWEWGESLVEYTISVWTINILACFSGCVCGGGGVGKRADSISGSGGGGSTPLPCNTLSCFLAVWGGGGESRGEYTIAVWTIHTLLSGMDGGEGKRADSSSGSGGRVLWSPPSLCGLYIPCYLAWGGEGKRADSSSGSGGRVLWSPPSLCGLYIPCRVFLAAQAPGVHRRCSPPCPPLGCTLNTYLPEHTQ